ncbi:MAG: alkaline phosphatase D family protein [Cyanobacteriota bacterium]|nr:alkaline phosphatase D family protein [Cyanobacteriota bacterium]
MATFEAVSAGSATSNSAVFWARASQAVEGSLVFGDARYGLKRGHRTKVPVRSNASTDHTIKQLVNGLTPGIAYSYTFRTNGGVKSEQGTVRTAPGTDAITGVRFGFGGCASAEYAPLNAVADVPRLGLDFFMMLGDAAYEDDFIDRNGVKQAAAEPPVDPAKPGETSEAFIKASTAAMASKYRANLDPQIGNLAPLYRAQGILAAYDNHETVDSAFENGGAPRSAVTTFMGRKGYSFREGADFDKTNANNMVFNRSTSFINKSPEHRALLDVWAQYMPIQPTLQSTPNDPRTDNTYKLYGAQQWGRHAIAITTDLRSYRDAKYTQLSKDSTSESDFSGKDVDGNVITEATQDNAKDAELRTMLGDTQKTWLKQTLLDAQQAGTTWKFLFLASPIDQTGRVSDGKPGFAEIEAGAAWIDNKSWWGNYRQERNEILRFIAENKITNVVLLATDDHEARINEVLYAPAGVALDDLTNYQYVPGAISVVTSPIGASRPAESFVNKDLVGIADTLTGNYLKGNIDPIGLRPGFPGLASLKRQATGTHTAADVNNPKPIDFWSPDTFNYGLLDVNPAGQLTVSVRGIAPNPVNESAADWRPIGSADAVAEILSFTLSPLA